MTETSPTSQPWQRERAWLGYAGLIPFVVCGVIIAADPQPSWTQVAIDTLRHYAAVIASFLGAVHWGVAADRHDPYQRARLRWGIMPALIAWTLLAVPATAAFYGFAFLFAAILIVDRQLLPVLDDAYRKLRVQLTTIAVIVLIAAGVVVPPGTPT